MSNPLDRLRVIKDRDTKDDSDRQAYQNFINTCREYLGWSSDDVAEYAASVKILMGKDDEKALGLFPAGVYKTADEARDSAKKYWRTAA